MKHHLWTVSVMAIIVCLLMSGFFTAKPVSAQDTPTPTPPLRIGLMGDSTIDEYHGTDKRGGNFANVTYNWLEQLVRERNISAGTWGNYDEPRRTGYEYNWARSASTAATVLSEGQATGLAAQVKAGDIDLVIMAVGDQDFAPYNKNGYQPIYDGTLTDDQVTAKVTNIINDYTTAVDTILAVKKIPMIVTTIGDFNLSPLVLNDKRFPDAQRRQRVSDAVAKANAGIEAMAKDRGLGVFDTTAFAMDELNRLKDGKLIVGNVPIDFTQSGDDPHDLILGDGIHGGTVFEGLIANAYLTLINQYVNPQIPLFTDQEILATAGLSS